MKSLILSLFALLALPLQAQYDASEGSLGLDSAAAGESTSTSEMISEVKSIAPGQSFRVAFKLTHPPHYHSYYHNDGIGISLIPTIEWTLPSGFTASPLVYPVPKEFTFSEMKAYGYEETNYFLTTITAPATIKPGESIKISADANWQICDDKSCFPPENATPALTLTVAEKSEPNPAFDELKSYIAQKIPTPDLPADWKVSVAEKNGNITLSITGDLPKDLKFYEFDGQIDAQQETTHTVNGQQHDFVGKRNKGNKFSEAKPALPNLRGILVTPTQSFWIDLSLSGTTAQPAAANDAKEAGSSSVATSDINNGVPAEKKLNIYLVFALLLVGGFVLNLMPCVFPVIGLKIMGFVQQAGEDKAKIKLHGLVFTSGVLLSFLVFGIVLEPIRKFTTLGSQLQDPWVVFILLIVMLLLALSMSGLFEIGTKATSVGGNLTQKDGIAGSFFSGVLAVVIATPCAAPFLAAAIGAAWNYDGILFYLALLTMGVGLSLPYLFLAFYPSLVKKLPRPGAWMESFKQGMAFLLYAVVGFLLWLYMAHVGEDNQGQKGLAVMFGLTFVALASWIYGRWNLPSKSTKARYTAKAFALAAIVSGVLISMPEASQDEDEDATTTSSATEIEWQKWSPEKVEALLAEGKPVYVDFTAKWCLTCQTNKATAYSEEVRELIQQHNIVMLKADMTKKHPTATQAVHALGRSAIPVNVLYVPGDSTPHVTRTILTPGYLHDFLSERLKK